MIAQLFPIEKPNPLTQNEKHVCLAGVLFLTLIAA